MTSTALWTTPVGSYGGVARHVLDVARTGLPGWRLVVAAPGGELLSELEALGIETLPVEIGEGVPVLTAVRAMRGAIESVRPQVVHSHLARADVLAALATVGLPTKLVTTEHTIAADSSIYHSNAVKALGRKAMHHTRLRAADHVIAVSQFTADEMRRQWWPSCPVTVILNGVDRVAARTTATEPRFLSLSRLSPEKGVETAIRAFARLLTEIPDAHLTVAGDGPMGDELRELTRVLGIADHVSFPGFLDAREALESHAVLLQPARAENLSYSILDALAMGLGLVATRVGGNPELLPERCLVDVGDVDGLASAARAQLTDVDARPGVPDSVPTVREMCDRVAAVYDEVWS